ncbi:hypothetical protein Ferp_2044 [Ferroglobus placidus DSM 10642]|uniref:Uncharacterized protein n=1 Tax=Ferroglobus placidus (strain DSM 10642 / AEDII12DO) TaxID=589924 RepID=D3S0B5_FERPA|nr:hypothetical protein [Ferroglobus placidus]ADC66178.1 hypothetical protein Ferp_2044 [Ferroglobus placidus DSM 10642]
MRWVKAKLEVSGKDGLAEIGVYVYEGGVSVEKFSDKAVLRIGNSITLEMDSESFEELKKALSTAELHL